MRHRVRKCRLGRRPDHQLALRRNLAYALLDNGKIETTLAKAKMIRPIVEKLITLAKKGNANEGERQRFLSTAISFFSSGQNARKFEELTNKQRKERKKLKAAGKEVPNIEKPRIVTRLFNEIAPAYADRPGGYTRIHKLGSRRLGDNAEMAVISLV